MKRKKKTLIGRLALAFTTILIVISAATTASAAPYKVTNPKAKAAICKTVKWKNTKWCGEKRPAPPGGWPIPTPTSTVEVPIPLP